MKRIFVFLMLILVIVLTACRTTVADRVSENETRIGIKVLILPKLESGAMCGDFPGEAQFYYEGYLEGGDEYEINGGFADHKLYVKDGVALYLTGPGKVSAATSIFAVLSDDRFDFSDAYIISTGCCGTKPELTVMGDVIVASAVLAVETYGCPDPYMITEMEDVAIGVALKRLGMLDRYITIRGIVRECAEECACRSGRIREG